MMYFECRKVLDYLLKNRVVFTVRRHRYKVGRDWITDARGNMMADVNITEIGQLYDYNSLAGLYLSNSGFDTVEDWIAEIHKLHRSDSQRPFYLYKVESTKEGSN